MTPNRLLLVTLIAAGALAGCDNGGSSSPEPPVAMRTPLAQIVQDSFDNTSETALPVDINALDPDPSDDTPTLYDNLLQ